MSSPDHAPRSAPRPGPPVWSAALAGALAAGLALAVAEFFGGLVQAVPSLIELVGGVVIDNAPPGVEDFAISVFGTSDKVALQIGTVILALTFGAGLGLLARHRFMWGAAGITLFALLGVLAAFSSPQFSPVAAAVAAGLGVAAGIAALRWMLSALEGRAAKRSAGIDGGGGADRRSFLTAALTVAGAAVVTAVGARLAGMRSSVAAVRQLVDLPDVNNPLPSPDDAATLEIDGLAPLFTPNETFYRIDTALSVPRVDAETWRMRITGLVDRPYELSYADLQGMADTEADITLACVSNRVGGGLVGNARWLGVPLSDVLERAGVQVEGTQIVGRAVDGFTVGFPADAAFDGREALVAIGMNGEPLPLQHGYPARLVVPGLYGYVSATKWLSEIELATWDFDAYWVPRGWAKEGPIKTQSRIDVPATGRQVAADSAVVAGVAWAPTRGIERVEVQIDDGQWQEASLAQSIGEDSWRQWRLDWDAEPGSHRLRVRATDGTGQTQTEQRSEPRPDGATGYHSIEVTVT